MSIKANLNLDTHKYLAGIIKKQTGLTINFKASQDAMRNVAGVVLSNINGKFDDNSELLSLVKRMTVSKRIQNKQLLRMLSLLEEDYLIGVTDEEYLENGLIYYNNK